MLMKNFLKNITTADETWVYDYHVTTKAIFAMGQRTVTQTQKCTASLVHCESDAMFFDCEGVIHHEFLPRGQTVNKKYYLKVMERLREAVRR